ncbi:hypothetical protein ACFSKN_18380 [Mariniflexile gromovii]|uniref:Glycosyl hydrolase family 43 n=1 Tax=Mariniflexile gromovii TaxID=362523 RepID=A0ABS4BX21_9FLAO|nr:hypothetical protein [Mariniflexile gromovii]MBP0904933.1 hypothetical protein [Mariniflexile gromovii]
MKNKIHSFILLTLVILAFSCKKELLVKESSFVKSHIPGKYILDAPKDWWHWGMAPIYDASGKLHVFMSAIPNAGSWSKNSKIVHYKGNSPEGPYTFVDTTFASKTHTYHNPQISQVDDTYILVYLLKSIETDGHWF